MNRLANSPNNCHERSCAAGMNCAVFSTMKVVQGESVGQRVGAGRGRLSEPARARIPELGIPLDGKIAESYPAESWAACVKLMADDMFPGIEREEAQRRLAHLRMDQFAATAKGKFVFAFARFG